jgi:ribosomal-protein-alanine N-acetyltransferase
LKICGADNAATNKGFDYIELAGKTVRLRTTTASDAVPAYCMLHDNQAILRWLCWNGPASEKELAETFGKLWPQELRRGTRYAFAIEEYNRPGIIGCIDARVLWYPLQFEAGYWLAVPCWGKGYATEALSLICYLCFHHLQATMVQSNAFTSNLASRRVMEKNGFTFEGKLRRQFFKDGQWIDLWHLSLLREEWETQGFKPDYEQLVPHKNQPLSGLRDIHLWPRKERP